MAASTAAVPSVILRRRHNIIIHDLRLDLSASGEVSGVDLPSRTVVVARLTRAKPIQAQPYVSVDHASLEIHFCARSGCASALFSRTRATGCSSAFLRPAHVRKLWRAHSDSAVQRSLQNKVVARDAASVIRYAPVCCLAGGSAGLCVASMPWCLRFTLLAAFVELMPQSF